MGCGEVIRGWEEGLLRMSQGEKATVALRSDYAFGDLTATQRRRWLSEVGGRLVVVDVG
eukprot:Skav235854  [mRNA]  locus=scaffold1693:118748:118924:- [translate_table: standard]